MERWYFLWHEDIKYHTTLDCMTAELLAKNIELNFKFSLQGGHFHKFNSLKVHTGEILSAFMTGWRVTLPAVTLSLGTFCNQLYFELRTHLSYWTVRLIRSQALSQTSVQLLHITYHPVHTYCLEECYVFCKISSKSLLGKVMCMSFHLWSIPFHLSWPKLQPTRFLTWRLPWTEEPGRLQSMGSQRVRHNWATNGQWTGFSSRLRRVLSNCKMFRQESQCNFRTMSS